jgi:predicted DNA-binding protein with PD1-like motif
MLHKRVGERFIVRLESGEALVDSLTGLLSDAGVGFANVSAAGAVNWAQLAYWNAETRKYEERAFSEQLEVVSFEGNASLKDGKPFLHIHAVFGRRDFSTIGGHVKDLRVHPTMEIWLRTEDVDVLRVHDEATGLDVLGLDER